ncbi:DUF6159 family protein [Tahibacter amnicola]|uniref:DUF6159 family protein n=1 Tax=Tahibacter amnicola TaxID=2976241 RepID=A0ABY6BIN0_9GAMM|nr:DUF6159 family protein [Tahibacter amnicola]UXI68230.1 DUF6159 family protein [Tahibacter amnicola]
MFSRLSLSWQLMRASAAVLRSDKVLLAFPFFSGVSLALVAATFFVPAFLGGLFVGASTGNVDPALAALGFVFYLAQYFVIIFFNTALIGAAMIRLRGGTPTFNDGLRIAVGKLPAILGYALISATVGLALRLLSERLGFLGQWVVKLLGAAWTVATYMAVPVLVSTDVGPVEAVRRSVSLLKKTWGENLVGHAGFSLVFGLLIAVVVISGVVLMMAGASANSRATTVVAMTYIVIGMATLSLIQAAMQGIYAAALYRYADEGIVSDGFDQGLIVHAFEPKPR